MLTEKFFLAWAYQTLNKHIVSPFISDGNILFVWVKHKTFELDKWIKQLFIVKQRATEQL